MDTKKLLAFIIEQELDLEQYQTLVPLLKEKFQITEIGGGITDATQELVNTIIKWENSTDDDALEKIINSKYVIYLR